MLLGLLEALAGGDGVVTGPVQRHVPFLRPPAHPDPAEVHFERELGFVDQHVGLCEVERRPRVGGIFLELLFQQLLVSQPPLPAVLAVGLGCLGHRPNPIYQNHPRMRRKGVDMTHAQELNAQLDRATVGKTADWQGDGGKWQVQYLNLEVQPGAGCALWPNQFERACKFKVGLPWF